jgi:hypothetical protein
MFPWLWFWSPTFYYPFSGSVAQQIEPDTTWFFAGIPPGAGNRLLEKKAFEVASYGRQLGWITEVLLAEKKPGSVSPAKAAESLSKLETVHHKIEAVIRQSRAELAEAAASALAKLHEADPAAYTVLLSSARTRMETPT